MNVEIEFEYVPIYSGEYPGEYSCKITKAAIATPDVTIISFKGIHHPRKNNNDVIHLHFENAKVEYFPRNLQTFFPNLKTVAIRNC